MNLPMWFSNLLSWAVQVGLLALAAALLLRLFRIREPRFLLAFWRSLLVISLALPLLQPWRRPASVPTIAVVSPFDEAPLAPSSVPADPRSHLPSIDVLAEGVAIILFAGVIARLLLLGMGLVKLRKFRQASSPVPAGSEPSAILDEMRTRLHADAEFRLSSRIDSPVTFGFTHPVILLPERFLSLDARFQSAIACHELLHVRRRDWGHHLAEEVVRSAFWFHPAIAWFISRVRLAREQLVDLEVLAVTSARKVYLEALLEFTGSRTPIAAVPAPPFLAECQLVERVALMLKEVRISRAKLIASLGVISCCLALVVGLAARSFPLKAAPLPASAARFDTASVQNGNPDGAQPTLDRIEVEHHDFGDSLNDAVLRDEQARIDQLPDRPTVDTTNDDARVDHMLKLLGDFWHERGFAVQVRATLDPSSRSPRYAILRFDVYKQTGLPGKLRGGINGGVVGGISCANCGGTAGSVASGTSTDLGSGIKNDVSGGVADGVSSGINGGVNGEIAKTQGGGEPSVAYDTIWTDTVKRGPMVRQIRGLGKLVSAADSTLVARITVPVFLTVDVRPNQSATLDTRMGLVKGHVVSINPSGDDCSIDVALDAALPERATAGLSIDATIDIETLNNVLYIHRPVHGNANTTIGLFKISKDGLEAQRVSVKLGRSSVNTIEVLDGLQAGDRIVLSDMSEYDGADHIRLTNEQRLNKK